jgi:UDP-glucose 4-epimerase
MRMLVTGARGTLGRELLPRLVATGHQAIGLDVLPGDPVEGVEQRVGDIRDGATVLEAAAGVDVIVHAAALHGIHLAGHAAREFLDLNVAGTFNVWEAAVEHHARAVVFGSTMGVYGESRQPAGPADVTFVHEDRSLRPTDVYGWSKVVGEELCRYHLRAHAIPSVALRFGMFVPEPFFRYGIRLLYGGVDVADVATAVIASIDRLLAGEIGHEAINVEAPLPFEPDDAATLRADPLAALDRHFPGASGLLRSRGVEGLAPIEEVFPVDRLRTRLGVTPAHDFGTWLEALRERPEERATAPVPWP